MQPKLPLPRLIIHNKPRVSQARKENEKEKPRKLLPKAVSTLTLTLLPALGSLRPPGLGAGRISCLALGKERGHLGLVGIRRLPTYVVIWMENLEHRRKALAGHLSNQLRSNDFQR